MDQTLLESKQLDLMFENMLLERRMTSLQEELESIEEYDNDDSNLHMTIILSEADWTGI